MYSGQVLDRKTAVSANLRFYFTGKPCKRGHIDQRRTSTGICVTCSKWHKKNNPTHEDPEVNRARARAWAHNNREILLARNAKWRRQNPERHRVTMSAVDARRRAAKLKAVPKWADSKAIKRIYWEARLLRRVFRADVEVDHIVPLQGRHVCGLHWEENLQIVFKKVNRIKSNRFTN
jgi:hypothetical protein